jgi:hypothetical protein
LPTERKFTIESLSRRQQAEMVRCRERWRVAGLSTAPIDPDRARRAVLALYRVHHIATPRIVTLASPMACLVARALVSRAPGDSVADLEREVDGRMLADVRHELARQSAPDGGRTIAANGPPWRDPWWDVLEALFCDQLACHPWDWLMDWLSTPLRAQLSAGLGRNLLAELTDHVRRGLKPPADVDGRVDLADVEPDIGCLAIYQFAGSIGARYSPGVRARLDAFVSCARNTGRLYAYPHVAVVSDRPAELHFDAQRRLHAATGMAVRFRDGWGVHAWHGLRVPARLIEERHRITPATVEAETNAELRRVALEIFGFDRYLAARGARVIASDELHGERRRLLEVRFAGAPVRIVEVTNGSAEPDGTRRRFHLGAMPGETPHHVIAASYGIVPDVYREAVRA